MESFGQTACPLWIRNVGNVLHITALYPIHNFKLHCNLFYFMPLLVIRENFS